MEGNTGFQRIEKKTIHLLKSQLFENQDLH